jgi:hypothetical protein
MVYAQLTEAASQVTATLGLTRSTVDARPGTPALVERAAARAQIADLEDQLAIATTPADTNALRSQIETRSIAARVVSSQATMLVLDNDSDYERYGIDRKALADILVVGPHGLEQQHRTFVASKGRTRRDLALSRDDAIAAARSAGLLGSEDETISMGSYGTIGHGYGAGEGVGYGRGYLRGHTVTVPTISIGAPVVSGSLDKNIIQRYLRRQIERISYCYERELLSRPRLHGIVETHFVISQNGRVEASTATGMDQRVAACVADVIAHMEFPAAERVMVNYPFSFHSPAAPEERAHSGVAETPSRDVGSNESTGSEPPPVPASLATHDLSALIDTRSPPINAEAAERANDISPSGSAATSATTEPAAPVAAAAASDWPELATQTLAVSAPDPTPPPPSDMPRFDPTTHALRGQLADIMRAIAKRDTGRALSLAHTWRDTQPTDVLAIIGLGEAEEAVGDVVAAARVYGSLIDLYPTRADYRRFAGERLERLGSIGQALAIDTYRRAVQDRPDQLTGHRLLAYALVRARDYAGAFDAILAGVDQKPVDGRFAGATRVFARDASMVAASYLAHGGDHDRIMKALAKRGLQPFTHRSMRVLLYWETDANDVDLHIRDSLGGHSWYSHKPLESGGELYADVTTGFGPECFEIVGTPSGGPYAIGVHYYRQGPMGYGMGLVQVETFDGKDFAFDDRPYIIMQDEAYVSLGNVR